MNKRFTSGFTLLEIMLAVTILALLIVVVSASWNAGLTGWKRGSQANDRFQRQRIVLETLSELTKSAMLISSQDGLYQIVGEKGEGADSISFVTGSDLLLPPSESVLTGMRRVAIFMTRDERGYPYLAIQNSAALNGDNTDIEPVTHVLSADVTGFAVRYRHPKDGTWEEAWDETALAPSAIEYTVAFGGADKKSKPTIVTTAVELPAAEYLMMLRGEKLGEGNPTNTETRARTDIPTMTGGGEDDE
jgi:general secretion pathway protein J